MQALELKLPPVVLVIIIGALMAVASSLFPSVAFAEVPLWSLLAIGGVAVTLPLLGIISFRKAQTTPDPRTPDATSTLVTSGIYRYTRNPMYVGFLLALFVWGLWLSNMAALFGLPVYMFYMNQFQIKPEERSLQKNFGTQYADYKKTANRWF